MVLVGLMLIVFVLTSSIEGKKTVNISKCGKKMCLVSDALDFGIQNHTVCRYKTCYSDLSVSNKTVNDWHFGLNKLVKHFSIGGVSGIELQEYKKFWFDGSKCLKWDVNKNCEIGRASCRERV